MEHEGRSPRIHATAWVAPSAVVCGDVRVGARSRILHGAVLAAESGPVTVGEECIVMENAVLRGVVRHPLSLGSRTLVGPHAHLTGCTVGPRCFLATRSSVFNGARIEAGGLVRIGATVHVNAHLPEGAAIPIGWVAVGDPARALPPDAAEEIIGGVREEGFSREVFGLPPDRDMADLASRYCKGLERYQGAVVIEPDAHREATP